MAFQDTNVLTLVNAFFKNLMCQRKADGLEGHVNL